MLEAGEARLFDVPMVHKLVPFVCSLAVAIAVDGEVQAVLVSTVKYERYRNALIEANWQMIQREQEWNADKDPHEILSEVTRVVEEVRQERYERERASRGDKVDE
jgi:hypothetical protein